MRPERGITSWLRAVMWGAFLIPLAAFALIAWWGFDRAERDAESSASRARDLALQHALRTFEVAEEIARFADDVSAGPAELAAAREPGIHQRLADVTAGLHSIVNLNVWDGAGKAVASSHIFPVDPRASNADREYFLAHKNNPDLKVGVSEVLKGRQLGRPLVNVTVRRKSSNGAFEGVVATSLSPDYFRAYYESLAKENQSIASFSLVRTDGRILARWPTSPDGRTQVPEDSLVLTRIRAGERSGNQALPTMSGREARFGSFSRVGDYPVYVMAGLSRRAMFESWTRFVALLAAFVFPVSAGLVYVSWVALKKTRQEQQTARELQDQIQRRAAAEKGMIESQKLETLAVLTGGVAHDFNNLLAVVSGSVHVHRRLHPQAAGDKHLESIMRSVQSGVRLTRQLLSFSRKQALRPETLKLQHWLPTTEDLIRTALGSRIGWVLEIDPETAPVTVDPGELELALLNLVVNARHAMPEGGAVTVHVRNAASPDATGKAMVEIEVADTGVGIAPEVLPRVFEAFFTTRERGLGSGLGLSQVNGFCHQAGGTAEIDSVVGQGTRVRLLLPASAQAVDVPVVAKPPQPSHLAGSVLLVEDNDDVASSTAFVLRSAGLQVTRAANASEALARLRAGPVPDVVLSDIAMPGAMNGIALAFELRRTHPDLPVLLTTGYAEQVRQATADGLRVLPKPLDPDTLLAELRTVLSSVKNG